MRTLGWIFLILGFLSLFLALFAGGPSIAEVWGMIDANSLVGFQGVVDSYLDRDPGNPTVWFDYVLPALEVRALYVAAVVLGLVGVVIVT